MKKYENQLPQAGRGNVHVAYQGKAIDQMIYDFMEEQGIPGMTLAIVQAPYIPRVVGYGVTDFTKGNLAAAKTLWPIGPISQGYAAVAVMQLYERGKLDLNDPVGKYLKDPPVDAAQLGHRRLPRAEGFRRLCRLSSGTVDRDRSRTATGLRTGNGCEAERHELPAADFHH